jgi:hypothetical protein
VMRIYLPVAIKTRQLKTAQEANEAVSEKETKEQNAAADGPLLCSLARHPSSCLQWCVYSGAPSLVSSSRSLSSSRAPPFLARPFLYNP